MTVNQKLPIRLLGWAPLIVAACSSEIGGAPAPAISGVDEMQPVASGTLPNSSSNMISGTGLPPGGTNPPSTGGTETTAPTGTSGNDGPPSTSGEPSTPPSDVIDAIAAADPLPMRLDGKPIFARTVRLTHDQWARSVRDLLALDAPTSEREGLTDDAFGVHDFSNNELNLEVNPKLWADYQAAAEALASQVAASDAALARIYDGTDAAGFITTFGQRAFRRPLTSEEQATYQGIYDTGAELPGGGATPFARGAGLVIEAMLQSPHFLYRIEMSEAGDRLSSYELAAKLSLLLRGTTPSDELLSAAAEGAFDTDDGVANAASEMLEVADAVAVMRLYHGEMLGFSRFQSIEKQAVAEYSSAINADLEEAAYRFFDRVFESSLGVREMLTSTTAFASPAMASFYGKTLTGTGIQELTLDADRPGYFTQLPFLIVNSVNLIPDSIHRGVAINREVLCAEVPPPMVANVMLPPRQEGQSNREVVEAGTGMGTCGTGCHSVYINPLGFAFDNFDGLGRVRSTDGYDVDTGLEKPVDTTASYPFVEGVAEFSGASDLMQKMADNSQAHACYAKHLAGFFLQRDLVANDKALLDSLTTASQGTAGSVKGLVRLLVTSPAFTIRTSGDIQ